MWGLNGELLSPDQQLVRGASVRIGHLYTVRAVDNLEYLAVQFATDRGKVEAPIVHGLKSRVAASQACVGHASGPSPCSAPFLHLAQYRVKHRLPCGCGLAFTPVYWFGLWFGLAFCFSFQLSFSLKSSPFWLVVRLILA